MEDIRQNSDKNYRANNKNKDIYKIICTGISEGKED